MYPDPMLKPIRRNLLRWYNKNRRDLPWRSTIDPYAIWVAETMLQQTQVRTVLPYYRRFLEKFPTLATLDRAPKEKVLALWSGLGYYRRAENLKKAARVVTVRHAGKLPQDFNALLRLPGIGSYTAGALMSIAFNRPYPALDGNAKRVLSRLFNLQKVNELAEAARRLVSMSRPGHFNQALMDLGSRICLPRDPTCPVCPLATCCRAKASIRLRPQLRLNHRKAKNVEWPLLLMRENGKILLHRRPKGGVLEGLWEVPGGERKGSEKTEDTLAHHVTSLGYKKKNFLKIGEIRHSITYRKIRSPLFVLTVSKNLRFPDSSWRWVPIASLSRYPLSSLSLKAIRFLNEQRDFRPGYIEKYTV